MNIIQYSCAGAWSAPVECGGNVKQYMSFLN